MDPSSVYAPRFPHAGPFSRGQGFFLQQPERKRSVEELDEILPVAIKRHSTEAETVFRLLLPAARLGPVMNGTADVQLGSGCRMRLCEPVLTCDERVVVISAKDERKDDANVAMQGLLDAVRRALAAEQAARESARSPNHIYMIRLLINRTQAGAVIGKGGSLNKDIRERTGAYSKILTTEDIPDCALHNDRVVQVTGSVEQVMAGMEIIARQLRDNVPKERPGGPPPCLTCLNGFTLYYAHEAPPYIPATDYGRPIHQNALQSPSFQMPGAHAAGPMYGTRPTGYVPFTPPSGAPRMYNQPAIMYAGNQGRPPYNGNGPAFYY